MAPSRRMNRRQGLVLSVRISEDPGLALRALLIASILCPLTSAAPASAANTKNKAAPPIVLWSESQPGCTFSTSDDGKYSYGLWSRHIGITLWNEAREVES